MTPIPRFSSFDRPDLGTQTLERYLAALCRWAHEHQGEFERWEMRAWESVKGRRGDLDRRLSETI
jgi:hypothetical protein